MTKINIYSNDKVFPYIEGAMLNGKRVVKVIKGMRFEKITSAQGTDEKPVLLFHGTGKKLILNKTNIKRITAMYGPETDHWRDKPIELYAEKVKAFGAEHVSVRVSSNPPKDKDIPAEAAEAMRPIDDQEAGELLGQ